ncbi:MAG: hypothetical protein LIO76_08085 [Clostridiales bacterium]|nr:hypothetical protein [Clostridiales bacterium]
MEAKQSDNELRQYRKSVCGITILCDVIPMGNDCTICIRDEDGGHIGSAVMAIARPSLTGKGMSATSSVLNCLGHKDEEIARRIAERVAANLNCAVVCTCGIHMDGITQEQIRQILDACRGLEQTILNDLLTVYSR